MLYGNPRSSNDRRITAQMWLHSAALHTDNRLHSAARSPSSSLIYETCEAARLRNSAASVHSSALHGNIGLRECWSRCILLARSSLTPRKSLQRKCRGSVCGDDGKHGSDSKHSAADQYQRPDATKLPPIQGDNLVHLNRLGLSFDTACVNSGHRKPVRLMIGRDYNNPITRFK